MKLFGLYLTPLYFAIATVESERGATSSNVYQISDRFIADCNRIMTNPGCWWFPHFLLSDRLRRDKCEDMMRVYWLFWGARYERKTGNRVSYEVLARIHNGGPLGWKKVATESYWSKVRRVLIDMDMADAERWMDDRNQAHYKNFFAIAEKGVRDE